uniref:Uncharacterized protein n=1 Tax=Oryza barthii TaxID=65489 RepID=A0A0D3HK87_9ORYZ
MTVALVYKKRRKWEMNSQSGDGEMNVVEVKVLTNHVRVVAARCSCDNGRNSRDIAAAADLIHCIAQPPKYYGSAKNRTVIELDIPAMIALICWLVKFLGRSSVEQRGDDPSVHEQQKNMAVTTTMTCFVICKWNHDHVHAQDDKLGRKKMMKEVDVGQPSSLGLRRWHRLEVPRQWSVPSTIASSDSSRTMAYKRSGRASMLQHGVAEAAPAAAARHGWGGGVVVKQRGKEEGCCSY